MTFRSEPLEVGERTTAHLNLKFSIADMDRIAEMAKRRMKPEDIAWSLEATGLKTTPAEIARLLRRNGHLYFGLIGWGE
jgi:hypothetical protein